MGPVSHPAAGPPRNPVGVIQTSSPRRAPRNQEGSVQLVSAEPLRAESWLVRMNERILEYAGVDCTTEPGIEMLKALLRSKDSRQRASPLRGR